jgi:hypothetical protein
LGAEQRRLPPIDQSSSDPSFARFRSVLTDILLRRDVRSLTAVLSPTILNSFGGDGGIREFRQQWQLDKPQRSDLWKVLLTVIGLGCTSDGPRAFIAPYTFSRFPDSLDAFLYTVVVNRAAKLYKSPDASAPVIEQLHWDLLKLNADASPDQKWLQVVSAAGRSGWVHASDTRSPVDYRARFEKTGDTWKITYLLAGD